MIVLLKNQHPELSVKTAKAQRKAATTADQAPLVNSAQATGAQDIKKFSVINGFSAKMTDAEAANLRQNPSVEAVVADQQRVVNPLSDAQNAGHRRLRQGRGRHRSRRPDPGRQGPAGHLPDRPQQAAAGA